MHQIIMNMQYYHLLVQKYTIKHEKNLTLGGCGKCKLGLHKASIKVVSCVVLSHPIQTMWNIYWNHMLSLH